jgi:hypothetical protein
MSTPYNNYYGACMTSEGDCFETSLETCRAIGGRFQGPGTSCGGYQPPLMAAEESIDEGDLCSSGIHDIGINSCGQCFDDICLACHPEEIDHSATEKGDGWIMQFCKDCADYKRKLNTPCDCMIEVPDYVKSRCQECTSCFGCQAKIYEMGDYGSICVDCAKKGVIDGTWNTEQFNSQNQTNNSGKVNSVVLAITVGVMTGVATTIFGNILSEMWLDRLREDPELHTTPDDLEESV